MSAPHPKSIRRRILEILYAAYREDPLLMLTPDDIVQAGGVTREDLGANIHYLADRRLAELMLGYNPPLFNSARITPDGIDLVENRFEFDLRFPPALSELEHSMGALPHLLEDLMSQAELSPLDGDQRRALLRDVQYLRDEVARPAEQWRREVIGAVLTWIDDAVDDPDEALPALSGIQRLLEAPPDARGGNGAARGVPGRRTSPRCARVSDPAQEKTEGLQSGADTQDSLPSGDGSYEGRP